MATLQTARRNSFNHPEFLIARLRDDATPEKPIWVKSCTGYYHEGVGPCFPGHQGMPEEDWQKLERAITYMVQEPACTGIELNYGYRIDWIA